MTGRLLSVSAAVFLAVLRQADLARGACAGDCDGDGSVGVHEVITAVDIALGRADLDTCRGADRDGDGIAALDELGASIRNSIESCAGATPAPTRTPTPTAEPVPTAEAELLAWLEAGRYLDWRAESGVHESAGPHFGGVRVFLNDALYDSLDRGLEQHPAGAVAVKELYGSGSSLRGWSVMIKIDDESDFGEGWYWLEHFASSTFASGRGVAICTGCHSLGRDYVRIPFPLQ